MVFSTSRALSIESNDKAFLEAGIHENVKLIGVRKDKSQNGFPFIEFEFDKDGYKFTHTEWEPNKFPGDSDEQFNERVDTQIARIMQIMLAFFDKSLIDNFEAESFDAFLTWVKALMDSADKSRLLRAKIVYGNNGFTSFPRYAKYKFIEPMSIPADQSKIKPLGIDKFKRPEIGDKEKPAPTAADTFGAVQAPSTGSEDVPF